MTDEILGRGVELRIDGSVLVCFRSLTMTHNGELLDVTDSCSNGYRELATELAVRSVDLGIEAIMKRHVFRSRVLSGTAGALLFSNAQLVWPSSTGSGDGDVLSGNFVISAYSETAPHDNVVTISATLQSTGAYTFTPEVA
jgi:predicted secreted protein